jgi:hypothetical protein
VTEITLDGSLQLTTFGCPALRGANALEIYVSKPGTGALMPISAQNYSLVPNGIIKIGILLF